jgi:hypothetical protein
MMSPRHIAALTVAFGCTPLTKDARNRMKGNIPIDCLNYMIARTLPFRQIIQKSKLTRSHRSKSKRRVVLVGRLLGTSQQVTTKQKCSGYHSMQ